jgi:hypothetical protein|tara:strand:+ start:274 stop:504 length:231 start_codon:yes stop_codon:yes gene_type:complete
MKKSILSVYTLLVLFVAFGLSSCQKQKYCAQCYENISGYQASDFCGESDEVDDYIRELNSAGAASGQSWSCTKVSE